MKLGGAAKFVEAVCALHTLTIGEMQFRKATLTFVVLVGASVDDVSQLLEPLHFRSVLSTATLKRQQ
jgi:hypothetical protein